MSFVVIAAGFAFPEKAGKKAGKRPGVRRRARILHGAAWIGKIDGCAETPL
jgi:hypothetical protein